MSVGAASWACPRRSVQWLPLDVEADRLPGQAQGAAPMWYLPLSNDSFHFTLKCLHNILYINYLVYWCLPVILR
jgi:hypothetical protein